MNSLELMRVCWDANVPCISWGAPGEGKSDLADAEANNRGWNYSLIILANCDPTDVGGLPVTVTGTDGRTVVTRLPAKVFNDAVAADARGEITVIHFDEWNQAAPLNRAGVQNVMTSRMAGDIKLPDSVRFYLSCNDPKIAVGAGDLYPPEANRVVHIQWELGSDIWKDYMLSSKSKVETAEAGLIVGFLEQKGWVGFRQPADSAAVNKPFCTPRSWHMLGKILSTARKNGTDNGVVRQLVAGTVGDGMATEFMAFLKIREELAPPAEILAACDTYELPDYTRPDLSYLLFNAVGAYVLDNPSMDNWERGWRFMGRAKDNSHFDKACLGATIMSKALSMPHAQKQSKKLRKNPRPEMALFLPAFRELASLGEK